MQSRSATVLISCVCSLSAMLNGCGTLDLQATTRGRETSPGGQTESERPFYVSGDRLLDPCGNHVILRGVNEMVTFIPGKSGAAAFDQIALTHANSVRIYWRTSDTNPSELDTLLNDAEARRLLPIIYVFSGSADQNQGGASTVSDAVDYWIGSEILSVVKQHQDWLIIALREKVDDSSTSGWASRFDAAVARMRDAGIKVPLAIDAPGSGSNVEALLTSGQARMAADDLNRLLLNVNAGSLSDSPETLADALYTAQSAQLPILVGEISGLYHTDTYQCGNPYDFETVLKAADATKAGWLGWSWGAAKNQYCRDLDMTYGGTYGSWRENDWGRVMTQESYGIEQTSLPIEYVPGSPCK